MEFTHNLLSNNTLLPKDYENFIYLYHLRIKALNDNIFYYTIKNLANKPIFLRANFTTVLTSQFLLFLLEFFLFGFLYKKQPLMAVVIQIRHYNCFNQTFCSASSGVASLILNMKIGPIKNSTTLNTVITTAFSPLYLLNK